MNDRHNKILKILSEKNEVNVAELVKTLSVSGVTVRQDLSDLEDKGLIKRVHGGAVLGSPDKIANRLVYNYEEKLKIAKKAAEFVQNGETVFIESGSTNSLLAKELTKKNNITLLTSNLFIANEIKDFRSINIILMGGVYQAQSECLVGQLTKLCIEQFNFDKAFIGVDGFTIDTGFTGKDMLRAETTSAIVKKAKQNFILTDSSKFGRKALIKICDTSEITHLISDNVPAKEKQYLESVGIKVSCAN